MWIVEVLGDSDVVVHRYYLKVIDGSTYVPITSYLLNIDLLDLICLYVRVPFVRWADPSAIASALLLIRVYLVSMQRCDWRSSRDHCTWWT